MMTHQAIIVMQTRKAVSEFYRSKANADGYDGRCKSCDAVQCSERRKKKPRIENPTVSHKVLGIPIHTREDTSTRRIFMGE